VHSLGCPEEAAIALDFRAEVSVEEGLLELIRAAPSEANAIH
jgi:hypothetical protein